jgi:hypothetical protein
LRLYDESFSDGQLDPKLFEAYRGTTVDLFSSHLTAKNANFSHFCIPIAKSDEMPDFLKFFDFNTAVLEFNLSHQLTIP